MAPLAYSFWVWPLDFLLAAAWLAVFCVLVTVSPPADSIAPTPAKRNGTGITGASTGAAGTSTIPPGIDVAGAGCGAWRTVLAFSLIPMILYLASGLLGVYWTHEYGRIRPRTSGFLQRHKSRFGGKRTAGAATGTGSAAAPNGTGTVDQPMTSAQHHEPPPSTTVTPATPAAGDTRAAQAV
ncbi:hypothetical protein N658DRAFT_527923 [Parathielavia hyrcaniae]|uniref:Uncharacterized protein n=1 Tax=Parathielavia hyrcaniae TaxID=113614 RepID=A0AAN6SWQ7_9PEZI|nr:hypothetical protein N658DRAFT_527923 [Parathielavia hyrcaniae]